METIHRILKRLGRRIASRPTDEFHVHFHSGPQGQPVPCFDAACPNPRLSVAAERSGAQHE
jgi:hypothetical protein